MNGSLSRFRLLLSLSCMLLVLNACSTLTAPPAEPMPAKPAIIPSAPPNSVPTKPAPPKPAPSESMAKKSKQRALTVTATAYTSHRGQTDSTPDIAAWGDRLKPGMKCIAVSRDLIKLGLKHNTPVRIKGLPGVYLVKDKLNKRYAKRIDIYHGKDIKAARRWGKKKVQIEWGHHILEAESEKTAPEKDA
ncbi:hypothetical protein PCS_01296 [Desulfocurvibacter africanus PCS]|uniref:3D domain-containing protein n=1 Tax=Desulfocurvibacter africanus PCS TaxID=1262666 RepID=M5Q1V6_DESAF|nr:3D domain-containing protein [Desulfocurvibacter africanus]EMG37901.1 hypothetical protein PCS_01296 [Desulfocurvibacter africanus PCS]